MSTFAGLWPALITPFTEDNRLNFPVLEQIVEYLLTKSVSGLSFTPWNGEKSCPKETAVPTGQG